MGSTKEQPDISGRWTGTWAPFHPADATEDGAQRQRMDAMVERQGGDRWTSAFEAECNRPYKYVVEMEGRQAGGVVLFRGTTDLGSDDGGVFEWIGRATEREFIGFYASAGYTGVFTLSRPT